MIKKLLVVMVIAVVATTQFSGCHKKDKPQPQPSPTPSPSPNPYGPYYSVGQSFGGGKVFYVDASRQHGFIAATVDQTEAAWNDGALSITSATGTAIGTGMANTNALVDRLGNSARAAKICDTLTLNGFNDWFLPSKDELYILYRNRDSVGTFQNIQYWSSSDNGDGTGWHVDFSNGIMNHSQNINNRLPVRAIRAF